MDGSSVVMMIEPTCIQDGCNKWIIHHADISKRAFLSQVSETGSSEHLV